MSLFDNATSKMFYRHITCFSLIGHLQVYKLVLYCRACACDRLRGLVVRVPGHRSRGLGSISGPTKFSEIVGLELGSLSLTSTIEELLETKSSGSGLEN
jgi:hypothetical protein